MIGAAVLMGVGGGVSAYSQYQQGKAQERLNQYNAGVEEQKARDRERDGRILANVQRVQNQRILGKMRAARAKQGVDGATGTPLLVEASQSAELELSALEVNRTASIEAARSRQQAVMDRMAGKAARRAGTFGAAATILQSAGQMGSMFAQGKSIGRF